MVMPGARLHGSSVRGSAAAPVREVVTPTPIAPANSALPPSSLRRSSSPLPATGSSGSRPVRRRADLAIGFLPWCRRHPLSHCDAGLFLHRRLDVLIATEDVHHIVLQPLLVRQPRIHSMTRVCSAVATAGPVSGPSVPCLSTVLGRTATRCKWRTGK